MAPAGTSGTLGGGSGRLSFKNVMSLFRSARKEAWRKSSALRTASSFNSSGKDLARGFAAGPTLSGTGLRLDSDYLGLALGLREGAELHLAGLTLGVGLWPPALKLPLLPRLGVHPGWVSGG